MAQIKICKEANCHNAATTDDLCRLHYLRNWKKIKDESRKRAAKKLNKYIESIIRRHPDRYVEIIKKDLRSPDFERYVDENFGDETEVDKGEGVLDEPTYEEEIENLIRQLKIEKGF